MFDQIIEFVTTQLETNQLLAGGAVLGVLGILWTYIRTVPTTLLRWSRFLLVTELDIPDKTQTFHWVTEWLAQHKYMKKARRVCIMAKGEKAQMSPSPGWHLMWWMRRPMVIRRVRREGSGEMSHKPFRETWKITLLGSRKKVESFIKECQEAYDTDEDTLAVIEAGEYSWGVKDDRRKRPISSVILANGVSENLLDDVRTFVEDKDWYTRMSIPWRRGYLLTGPPGNGKSSLVVAIASEFDFPIYVINLNAVENPDSIARMFQDLPKKALLLLEDIDCVFEERKGNVPGIDLSLLLNLIDGVSATEGRLLFMTTNHSEKLDPALIRPGRIDKTVQLGNASRRQIERLYNRFFPVARNGVDFAANAWKYRPSMATLQGYLLVHRKDARAARANIKELGDDKKSNTRGDLPDDSVENTGGDSVRRDSKHDDFNDWLASKRIPAAAPRGRYSTSPSSGDSGGFGSTEEFTEESR